MMTTDIETFRTKFMDAALGLTARQTAQIVGSFTSGINWIRCSKGSMAESIALGRIYKFPPSLRTKLIQKLKRAKRITLPKKKKRRKAKKKVTAKAAVMKKAKIQKRSAKDRAMRLFWLTFDSDLGDNVEFHVLANNVDEAERMVRRQLDNDPLDDWEFTASQSWRTDRKRPVIVGQSPV